MSKRDIKTEVLIVGGGPAGLVMAICLAKCGIKCIIIERQHGINPHPKAHELNTRSLEILASLGISTEELRVEASPKEDGCRIAFCTTINDEFGAIDLLNDIEDPDKYRRYLASEEPYLNISQVEVERILHKHAAELPEIDFRLGYEWQSVTQTNQHTESVIKDRAKDIVYTVRSSWLIATDGAGSRIRNALNIEMKGPDKIQDFINAYFELNLRDHINHPAKLYWITEPAAVGTFIAHHIDKRWVYNVPIYEPWESVEDYTEEVLAERIRVALGLSEQQEIKIKSTSAWRMTVQIAGQWREGRVFLAGDAAHRFPPTGGLGMNSGIADSHNLAWKLAQVIQGSASDTLLDTYQIERKPVAERNAKESLENFERIFDVFVMLGLPRNGAEQAARIRASWLLNILPDWCRFRLINMVNKAIRKKIHKAITNPEKKKKIQAEVQNQIPHFDRIGLDLGYIYTSSAVISDGAEHKPASVTEYLPSCKPGARFPHIWLSPETQKKSSHSLLTYRQWTLLSVGVKFSGQYVGEQPGGFSLEYPQVRHLDINDLDISEQGKQALIEMCGLGAAGVILIRPDGHVAFRLKGDAELCRSEYILKLKHLGLLQQSSTLIPINQ